ncbi:ABC transporter ATP-binding protein [Paeniglutamicibacter kerguelensis]|uniref:Peptide/nickel transport system ATP-binding protein n=1 Tax=Paeniglutamicibacter kerguelensis TaxID=254788 RepID=A0ABS4XGJ1_9MICC|nr:ABC transporter ATP-binding protein [Paeniglutamicibacter kerguelensis]MBP2387584.1 peptide/nickel transport system ATP-binding protein [Paeniglutamicibacter kerguelensis]
MKHVEPAGSTPLLEIKDLTVSFASRAGTATVVQGISLVVERNQTVGIVGESGSGKSMTSLAIMGLLPAKAATTGSIKLQGQEILGSPERHLHKLRGERMAMVFQDPLSSLNPYYTVGKQIAEAYKAHRGGSLRAAQAVAIDAMGRVGISDPKRRVDNYPHQFSGGMRQRIMIAMAMCCEPDLLIADEPTTALDVTVQAQILDLMSQLQAESGTGMVFITHDLAVVSQVSQRVLVMNKGHVVENGTTEDVFSNPRDPYTQALLDAIPRIDDPIRAMKKVNSGLVKEA